MCGIGGVVSLSGRPIPDLRGRLALMNRLLAHRGPDDSGTWVGDGDRVGLAHRRLTVIDLSPAGAQPMTGPGNMAVTYNGEIYNYVELRAELAGSWRFRTRSDTEVILAAYDRHGERCPEHLRGMFSFALADGDRLVCARDRFGIKPFYYATVGDLFLFASEVKALLPFLPDISTDLDALSEYLVLQYTMGEQTLFSGVRQLLPGHALAVEDGRVRVWRYWDVHYEIDLDHNNRYFERQLQSLLQDSLALHLRADVAVGSYLSGGIDSSLVTMLARLIGGEAGPSFHGRFTEHPGYDESEYARAVASEVESDFHEIDITAADFANNISDVIYHLDYPVAGPGAFPQYMVSQLAAEHVKVVLGGQGGDEIFGGYARYLLAYFEQCIKAAIDGTYRNGNFVVTPESIIPNLGVLREYKPLMAKFWREGLFGPLDARYFRLIDRSADLEHEVNWEVVDRERVFDTFSTVFNSERNVRKQAYFDSMTHFDFKCLLPALLHVEDRMSMAHGLESRVPFLDHPLIEFAASVPADVKFKDGDMKHLLKSAYAELLPPKVLGRRDKMGFPVPLSEWAGGKLRGFLHDVFGTPASASRDLLRADVIVASLDRDTRFGRRLWGLLSLELWHQVFHDRGHEYRKMAAEVAPTTEELA